MKKVFMSIAMMFLISITCFSESNIDIPKNIVVLKQNMVSNSQSVYPITLEITAVDLSNNELIILIYSTSRSFSANTKTELLEVRKTGIIVDIEKQIKIKE